MKYTGQEVRAVAASVGSYWKAHRDARDMLEEFAKTLPQMKMVAEWTRKEVEEQADSVENIYHERRPKAVAMLREYAKTLPQTCTSCGGDGACSGCKGTGYGSLKEWCTGCRPGCEISIGSPRPAEFCWYCNKRHISALDIAAPVC